MWIDAGVAFLGFIHAGELAAAGATDDIGVASGGRWALGYALCATFLLIAAKLQPAQGAAA